MNTCEICGGTGSIVVSSSCRKCHGTGEIIDYDDDGNESIYACSFCEYGLVFNEQVCDFCSGKGAIKN
jgi:RecJ-like exonuclease